MRNLGMLKILFYKLKYGKKIKIDMRQNLELTTLIKLYPVIA